MLRCLMSLLFLACTGGAFAQTKKTPPKPAPQQSDSIIRQTIIIDAKTMKHDTVYVRDLPRYTPEERLFMPADTEKIIILKTANKTVTQAMEQLADINRKQQTGKDEDGTIPFYNLPYTPPRLTLQIKLVRTVIRDIADLKFYLTVNNNSPQAQKFLFDRPKQPGFVLWGASCRIQSDAHPNVLRRGGKERFETRAADRATFDQHMFRLKPYEWVMKQFSVADMVELNEAVCKKGKLPPGTYTLQFILQNNYSNIVQFTVTKS